MGTNDLSTLDRHTLRVWRATNLIGWGLAGIGAFLVTRVLTEALVQRLGWFVGDLGAGSRTGGSAVAFGAVAVGISIFGAVASFLVPALVAGIVIGDHVYRWPGWTTIVASILPGTLLALRSTTQFALQEWALVMAFAAVIGLITARVARVRFESRPQALRAGAAR
jgi:hypothetical protein